MDEFEALLVAHRSAAERWVRLRVHSPSDAEDILQETYLAAFRRFDTLKDTAYFRPWLLGIARHKWADWCRRKCHHPEFPLETLPESGTDAPDSIVMDTLDSLPPRDRLMLRLFYEKTYSQKEIAQRLSIPVGTVKSRLHAARSRFAAAYPYPPKGVNRMQSRLPDILPPYSIRWVDEAPFSVEWEELMGWFIVPRLGERLFWGMYDLPARRLVAAYDMAVTGRASVHGLWGVSITGKALLPADLAEDDLMREPVEAAAACEEEWRFIAQLEDGYTRFLSAERTVNDEKVLTTFLDGEDFLNNWGFGEDNRGNPIHLSQKGLIQRSGDVILAPQAAAQDVVGRCLLTLDGQTHEAICVMDIGLYNEGVVSEQYLDRGGRTLLWRRFNRDDWKLDQYGGRWSQLLPENERLVINGVTYVHWYDCLCAR